MKKLALITVAMMASASIAVAQNADSSAYKAAHDKATSDYKAAKDRCSDTLSGNAKDVCQEEAKVARARAESDAVAQHKNNKRDLEKAHKKVAEAEYDLAKEKCDDLSGDAKSACVSQAKSVRDTSLASIKSGSYSTTAAATDTVREKTAAAADTMRDKTAGAGEVMSDSMITAKVKADMAADSQVKAMDVHVETQKGVVMLSGFVPSKAEADRAVQLARGVKGVNEVKSSIQIKK
ncbi:BON domain-containing protein [Pseudoduganella violacea]|uniref:Osmotically-inducible protein Y n=1 Tax=Pseudoduganella violacea TaxID=1715466 RepID=A0A7W5B795_9BURK|nr:BON domain-containing protein [Pseudoduganella violacea]MBB3117869.1 osmotically-inducible protein OsmY [Pseudoduganella violacea]